MTKEALELSADRHGLAEFLVAYANVKTINTADLLSVQQWVEQTESLVTQLQERERTNDTH